MLTRRVRGRSTSQPQRRRNSSADYPRPSRGAAATRPQTIQVPAAADSSTDDPRPSRGGAATRVPAHILAKFSSVGRFPRGMKKRRRRVIFRQLPVVLEVVVRADEPGGELFRKRLEVRRVDEEVRKPDDPDRRVDREAVRRVADGGQEPRVRRERNRVPARPGDAVGARAG